MYVLYMGLKGWLENKTYSQMTVIPKENSYINTHTHTHTHDSLTEDLLVIFSMGKKRKRQ